MIGICGLVLLVSWQAEPIAVTTVGIEGRARLESSRPLRARDALEGDEYLARIVQTRELPGGNFEVELAFLAELPGPFDLRELLTDPPEELGELIVQVDSLLPEEHDGALFEGARSRLPSYPSRTRWLPFAAVLWALPLLWVLVRWIRRPRIRPEPQASPPTLAERLEPLLGKASRGELDPAGKAKLDRLMLEAWSVSLRISDLPPGEAIAAIRRHDRAGALLGEVERWLYAPNGAEINSERVAELLEPYRTGRWAELPAEARP